jgi:hypothetical protein
MAESITEGTLTQFSKQVGDFVEQDEELATIETDKIDVSVNAPHFGIIKRLLVPKGIHLLSINLSQSFDRKRSLPQMEQRTMHMIALHCLQIVLSPKFRRWKPL